MKLEARALAVALSGCAAASCAAVSRGGAPVDEYALYRTTRVGEGADARLRAADRYLERYPRGRFRDEVRAWFERAEVAYWNDLRESEAGLERYLKTLPDGPHAERAAQRLTEISVVRDQREAAERQLGESARELNEKLAKADELRRAFVRAVTRFAALVATVDSWGERTSALPHAFLYHWRMSEPAARCRGDVCTKSQRFGYAIPDGGRLGPRVALVDVVVRLSRGGVRSVAIVGPELFSRLGEAVEIRAVRPDDGQARAEAIARSVQVVEAAIESAMPADTCAREAIAPVVLVRECGGRKLEMIAGGGVVDDSIVVRPAAGATP